MRQYATDYRLWGLISGCLFAPIAIAWHLTDDVDRLDRFRSDLMKLAIVCGVVGWAIHALAVVCGVRPSGSADVAQAAD
jgi:hypothetical protein